MEIAVKCQALTVKKKPCLFSGREYEIPLIGVTINVCGHHYWDLVELYETGTLEDMEERLQSWDFRY